MNKVNYDDTRGFVDAAAAVYAWVSSVDGKITRSETQSFVDYLNESDFVDAVAKDIFYETYESLLNAFTKDFEEGRLRAEVRIESFSGDKERSVALIKVARRALVADAVIDEAEEIVLAQIAKILDIDEGSLG